MERGTENQHCTRLRRLVHVAVFPRIILVELLVETNIALCMRMHESSDSESLSVHRVRA